MVGLGVTAWTPAESPTGTGQPDAALELEYVQHNHRVDDDYGSDPFVHREQAIRACYREALPRVVDRHQDQGHVDLLVLVGDDGYPKETRVHGRPETLENFGHCFTNAVKRDYFGVPTGHPAAAMGRYRLTLPDNAKEKRRAEPAKHNRVHARLLGRSPDDGDMAYLFTLARLRPIERCYDAFVAKRKVSGTVQLRISVDAHRDLVVRTKASKFRLRPVAKCIAEVAEAWIDARDVVWPREPLKVDYDLRAEAPPRAGGG